MKKVGLVVKCHQHAIETAQILTPWFTERGYSVVEKQATLSPISSDYLPPMSPTDKAPSDLSFIVVLGGDGTLISAIRWVRDSGVPVLGVNLGAFGFLTEATADQLFPVMEQLVRNDYLVEHRILLWARVIREGKEVSSHVLFNDVVVNKGALARIAHIHIDIDNTYLTTFRADGLIVATPTGSTAYSLSAGGPIVHPSLETILMTPICPFTLTNRPLIVPGTATIRIGIDEHDSDMFLTFDGQMGCPLSHKDTIIIQKAPYKAGMIKLPGKSYYDILKAKLSWSGR